MAQTGEAPKENDGPLCLYAQNAADASVHGGSQYVLQCKLLQKIPEGGLTFDTLSTFSIFYSEIFKKSFITVLTNEKEYGILKVSKQK